jgi:hypothetical protein
MRLEWPAYAGAHKVQCCIVLHKTPSGELVGEAPRVEVRDDRPISLRRRRVRTSGDLVAVTHP